jgi:hypothetical protein
MAHLHSSLFASLALAGASLLSLACGDDAATGTGGAGGAGASGPGSGAGSSTGGGGTGGDTTATGGSSTGGSGTGGGEPGACGVFTTFEDGKTPTTTLHVSTSGSDSSGDGSSGSPFATIARAVQEAAPGTAIEVHAGTYAGGLFFDGLAGTEAAPIWIGGAMGEAKPVLEGGGNALQLVRPRYVVLHDLEVRGSTANGISVDDGGDYADPEAARYVVFRDLDIHDIGSTGNQDCLKLSGLNDFWVKDSTFARCGGGSSGSAIDHVGCHRGVIAENDFSDLSASGNAVQCKGGSEDLTIVANEIRDGGARAINLGGSTGFEFFRPPLSPDAPNAEARRIHVIANVLVGSVAPIAFVGCVDCLAANNTIVTPENWVVRILQETVSGGGFTFAPASNGRFVNNVVFYEAGGISTHVNVGADTQPESFTFANNLWYAFDQPGSSTPSLPVTETGGLVGVDPGFVDAASGDYHLAPGSAAIGTGAAIAELLGDKDGVCFLAPPSVGAYEGGAP